MKKAILFSAVLSLCGGAAFGATHTVVKGDHLWGLAGTYYQNHFRWKVIHAANQDKIKDPHWIYPGQVFIIPDVPGPEIGEIGARPIETGMAVEVPPQAEAPKPVEAAAPVPASREPEPRESIPKAMREDTELPIKHDLSDELPPSMSGQYPSMRRLKVQKGWKEDGKITEFDGREIIAAQGDHVNAKIPQGAVIGDRFAVYRRDGLQEFDEDKKAVYLQTVGEVEVKRGLGKSVFNLLIIKSADSIQLGDLLKKGAL